MTTEAEYLEGIFICLCTMVSMAAGVTAGLINRSPLPPTAGEGRILAKTVIVTALVVSCVGFAAYGIIGP